MKKRRKNTRNKCPVDLEIKLQIEADSATVVKGSGAAEQSWNTSFCYRATQLFTCLLVTAISNVPRPN